MTGAALVLGATAGIGRELARELAAAGRTVVLAARDVSELDRLAADLRTRHRATVHVAPVDVTAYETHAAFHAAVGLATPEVSSVFVLCGTLGEQATAAVDPAHARAVLETNLVGVVSLVTPLVSALRDRGTGEIAIVGSVAGDRGRQSNYTYGAAKAGLATWAAGLRNDLFRSGVHVLTVKPGFVDTGMTWGKDGLFLVAAPGDVARGILRALRKRRNVVYLPWFWRPIMLIIRLVPEPLFKRLRL